jgi:hypothetical protein
VRQQVSRLARLVLDEVRYLRCEPLVLKHLCSSRTLVGIGSQAGRNEVPGSVRDNGPIFICKLVRWLQ